jgi:CheY-like chemotaxis protein
MNKPSFIYFEDDVFSRKVLNLLLTKVMKFTDITIFEDSARFIERMQSLSSVPDVVFLDIQIGPHDGFEVLQTLRELPDYQETTFIAMTANVMSHDVTKLREVGFNGLIGKPIINHLFPQLIEQILDGESVWFVP